MPEDWHAWLRKKEAPKWLDGEPVFRILDVCSGCGGLSLGLKTAFQDSAYSVEIIGLEMEKWSTHTYQKNDVGQAIKCDIRKMPLRRKALFDIIVGGVPCQGFSTANTSRRRNVQIDPRNDLIYVFADIVRKYQPLRFLFENVPGLLSLRWNGKKGGWFQRLLYAFSVAGYAWEWRLINAVHYGIPQNRKRIIVLGWQVGLPRWHFPRPTNYCSDRRCLECGPYILEEMIRDYPNVKNYRDLE